MSYPVYDINLSEVGRFRKPRRPIVTDSRRGRNSRKFHLNRAAKAPVMQVGKKQVTMDPIHSVGEVRVADDADYAKIKLLCECHEGWKQEFNKSGTTAWTRANEVSDFNMIKVISFNSNWLNVVRRR